ncbi:MAG: MoaD/ThiS family protein [Pirellulales bacterium]
MATVFIPPQLRDLSAGRASVAVDGENLRQVFAALDRECPGFLARVARGEGLAPGLAVSIDGVVTSRGFRAAVGEASEIHFLPAIGGG